MVVLHGETQLLEVVDALGAPGGLTRRLDRRQEQGNQHCNYGDHHQQLDQCEGSTMMHFEVDSQK